MDKNTDSLRQIFVYNNGAITINSDDNFPKHVKHAFPGLDCAKRTIRTSYDNN